MKLEVKNLTKSFGEKEVLHGISFDVEGGKALGLLGRNGAGKTTTIKMLTGILRPTSGTVAINGADIEKEPVKAKQAIGYIADNPDIFLHLTGFEYVNFIADIYGVSEADRKKRIEQMADRFGMEDSLNKKMLGYSHGMRQKMMVTHLKYRVISGQHIHH